MAAHSNQLCKGLQCQVCCLYGFVACVLAHLFLFCCVLYAGLECFRADGLVLSKATKYEQTTCSRLFPINIIPPQVKKRATNKVDSKQVEMRLPIGLNVCTGFDDFRRTFKIRAFAFGSGME
eukprot:6185830-Amphidinium_carterae.1